MSKTINDIVREMRKDMPRVVDTKVILCNYADRIEAAAKALEADRDNWRRQALAEDERANIANSTKPLNMANREETDHFRDVTKMDTNSELLKSINSYQINSSKAREALEKCLRYLDIGEAGLSKGECDVMRKVMRDALSNPPRNCDIGTVREQDFRFNDFCGSHDGCDNCPLHKGIDECAIEWGQMPYEKGTTDEQ